MTESIEVYREEVAFLNEENERMRGALEFYQMEAYAISQNFNKNDMALLGSITVLKLDAGRRATEALSGQSLREKE